MFVGMDVHRNRTQVCVVDRKGNEVSNHNVVNDRELLRKELAGLRRGTQVAFEAAYDTGWIAGLLGDIGLDPHLAHPSGCRAIADAKLKHDRVDARTLTCFGPATWQRRGWRHKKCESSVCYLESGRGSCAFAPPLRTASVPNSPTKVSVLRVSACGPRPGTTGSPK